MLVNLFYYRFSLEVHYLATYSLAMFVWDCLHHCYSAAKFDN